MRIKLHTNHPHLPAPCLQASLSYLDLLRLLAALIVCTGHLSRNSLTLGKGWQLAAYGQTAVMVFFVISGYVIAWMTHSKEKSARYYFSARFSRVYSVLLPALILTAICDWWGLQANPAFYFNGEVPFPAGGQQINYIASGLLLQNIWDLQLNPGSNRALWSLTFEWIYYLMCGAWLFTSGWVRFCCIACLCAIAGPTILALLPVWLMGYLIYFLHRREQHPSKMSAAMSGMGLLGLCVLPWVFRDHAAHIPWVLRDNLFLDYLWGMLAGMHILGLRCLFFYANIARHLLVRHSYRIHQLAGYTFALYLCHSPVIQLMSALNTPDIQDWWFYGLQWVVVLTATCAMGIVSAWLHHSFKKWLHAYIHRR